MQYQPLLQSSFYLNCIIVVSNNMNFAYKFMDDFIQQKPRFYNTKNFRKNTFTASFSKLHTHKLHQCHLQCNVSMLLIEFYKILCNGSRDKIIIKILEKTEKQSPLQSYTYLNCITVISNNTYLAQKFLYGFIHQKPRFALSENFWKKCDYNAP